MTPSQTSSNKPLSHITVSISPEIPQGSCQNLLKDLQTSLASSSRMLHNMTGLQIHKVTVILPSSWLISNCSINGISSSSSTSTFFPSDIIVSNKPTDRISVVQYGQCGEKGRHLIIPVDSVNGSSRKILDALLRYQFGFFDTYGQVDDERFPEKYTLGEDEVENCESCRFDESCYDAAAPTKQNLLCNGRSPISVIRSNIKQDESLFSAPQMEFVTFKRSRYILVLDRSKQSKKIWNSLHNALYR